MALIPVSDEQVIRFFKRIGRKARSFAATRLASRRARIVTASALLVVFSALGFALRPRPTTIPIQGLVLRVEAQDILDEKTGVPYCRALIAVGDTTETSLLLPPPVPDVGHFVPLRKKWGADYSLDLETWNRKGPS